MQAPYTAHRDSKAREAGFKAGLERKLLNKCPHEHGSIQEKSWLEGYTEAVEKKKLRVAHEAIAA